MNQHIPLKNNFKIYWLQLANQNEGASGNMIYLPHSQYHEVKRRNKIFHSNDTS